MAHDCHVTLERVRLVALGADEAPLPKRSLVQPEESVEGIDLGGALADIGLGEFRLGLAEPIDPDEGVDEAVVVLVVERPLHLFSPPLRAGLGAHLYPCRSQLELLRTPPVVDVHGLEVGGEVVHRGGGELAQFALVFHLASSLSTLSFVISFGRENNQLFIV